MKNSDNQNYAIQKEKYIESRFILETYFVDTLQKMYYAENQVSIAFGAIKDQILSKDLEAILNIHFAIHLKHKERLEKIFLSKNETIKNKNCEAFDALLSEGIRQLDIFSDDIINWEIALILVSQKLAHYKIASYGGLAHLAINLNNYSAATLLAVSVQEEEEYINHNLNQIIDAFFASYIKGYKSEVI